MLAGVNEWVRSAGAPVVGIQADAMELPIESGSVDVAFAFHMLPPTQLAVGAGTIRRRHG